MPRPGRLASGWLAWLVAILSAVRSPGPALRAAESAPFGLDRRIPWTTSRVAGTPDPPLPYTTEPYRPGVPLKNPVFVIGEPGTSHLVVVLQGGEKERPSR
ncbi:MAG: hypothetical protein ACKOET_02795, partial [Verrucomicrobiota bacterium]